MPWKITLACLLAANLMLGACAPLIIVGTAAAAGGLTASELRTAETGTKASTPTAAAPTAAAPTAAVPSAAAPSETGELVAAPVESVESRSLE